MRRRFFLQFSSLIALSVALCSSFQMSARASGDIDIDIILHDPEAPNGGDPKGDVTIVAYLDYNCPFCKKATPDLDRLIKTDGHIRLVYKDWPILSEASVYGAQMALAAKYQGKYEDVHVALMAITGRKITKDVMLETIKTSGVDMARLEVDLANHSSDIAALLKRNNLQADSMDMQGTPVFLIGPFKIAEALDYEGFKDAVAKVRARPAK